jgi:hypothetical protein
VRHEIPRHAIVRTIKKDIHEVQSL